MYGISYLVPVKTEMVKICHILDFEMTFHVHNAHLEFNEKCHFKFKWQKCMSARLKYLEVFTSTLVAAKRQYHFTVETI